MHPTRLHAARTLAIAGVLVLACQATPRAMYPGPPRPASAVALLQAPNSAQAGLYGIDGQRVRGTAFHLEPGAHDVWAHVRVVLLEDMMEYSIERYCGIAIDVSAGRTYQLRVVKEYGKRTAAGSEVKIAAKVVDVSSDLEFHASYCGGQPDLHD